jgi:hypothetical protein
MKKPSSKQKCEGHSYCSYRNGEEKCYKWAMGTSEFCSAHSLAMPADEAAEANAFGKETAAAMREELGVGSNVELHRENMRDTKDFEEPVPSKEPKISEEQANDPIKYAMDMALEEVARAYSEDNEARAKSRNPGMNMSATDRARMSLAAYMPEFDDVAAMVSLKTGKTLVRPGWIPRWIRDKDVDGKPNSRRLRSFYSQGAEDVMDDDGRPLVGQLGRAVQIPPEVYAARVLRYSPSGAFDSIPQVQNAMDVAESMNRSAGRKVVDVRASPDHGSRKGEW